MRVPFKLKDWTGKVRDFTLESEKEVKNIVLFILAGDEVVYITFADGERQIFDSCEDRVMSMFDDFRVISLEELQQLNQEGDK